MTLYEYLIECLDYTGNEAEETIIRSINGMELPENIIEDIKRYYNTTYSQE